MNRDLALQCPCFKKLSKAAVHRVFDKATGQIDLFPTGESRRQFAE